MSGLTPLAEIAAALVPGQWSSQLAPAHYLGGGEINTNIGYQGDGPTGQAAAPGSWPAFYASNSVAYNPLLVYCGSAHWLERNGGEFWFLAGTTGWAGGSISAVRYQAATDRFRHWQGLTHENDTPGALFQGYGCSHNHEGTCLDPATGLIYKDIAPDSVNQVSGSFARRLAIWDTATLTGTTVTSPVGTTGYPSLEFVPSLGAQGSVIAIQRGGTFTIRRYDVATATWSSLASVTVAGAGAPTCPHGGNAYFTGGNSTLYRVTPAGALETRATAPVPMNKGHDGSTVDTTRLVPVGQYIYALHSSGSVYRYDTELNSWSGVVDTIPWTTMGAATCCAVPSLGVVMIVRQLDSAARTAESQLWKPPT